MKKITLFLSIFFSSLLLFTSSITFDAQEEKTSWTSSLTTFMMKKAQFRSIINASETEAYLSNNGYPVTVPFNYEDSTGIDFDCLNFDDEFAAMSEYQQMESPYTNSNLRGIYYYSMVDKSLQNKHQLSDRVASYGRKVTVWKWAKRNNVPGNDTQTGFTGLHGNGSLSEDESNRLIAYINELDTKELAEVVDFEINFDGQVSRTNPQTTTNININQHLPFTVTLNNNEAYVTDVNGNRKADFQADESFKIVAPASFKQSINVTVTTHQADLMFIFMKANVDGKQDLLTRKGIDPVQKQQSISLEFKGSYDTIKITKSGEAVTGKKMLSDTTYLFAKDQAFTQNVKEFVTDTNGNIEVSDYLLAGETAYIKEKSAPILDSYEGYNINSEVTELTGEGGKLHISEFTNERIKGKICIYKQDDAGNYLANVEFTLYTVDGRFIDKKVTDSNGKLCFNDLELARYRVVEDVPAGYEAESLAIDVDLKIDEQLVALGKNDLSNYSVNQDLNIINKKVVITEPKKPEKPITPQVEELQKITTPVSTTLPHTGEKTWVWLLIGFIILASAIGAVWLTVYKKRVKKISIKAK